MIEVREFYNKLSVNFNCLSLYLSIYLTLSLFRSNKYICKEKRE